MIEIELIKIRNNCLPLLFISALQFRAKREWFLIIMKSNWWNQFTETFFSVAKKKYINGKFTFIHCPLVILNKSEMNWNVDAALL